MHSHHAVVNFATVSVPLPTDAHGIFATLGRAGLVHAADRVGVGVLGGHDLLTPISELLFIPLDRFEKTL